MCALKQLISPVNMFFYSDVRIWLEGAAIATPPFVMTRSYGRIQQYEKEILELKKQGLTLRQIGERLGFSQKQVHNFITRYNEKQRKLAAGIVLRRKGRPSKNDKYTETDKVNELKYIIARKDAKIKALEMENELMRDFLSLTERK
ncbi:helix-turn-helix domain-containing protein [Ruminococcus albus]|nr:helix-turn-helix domain-containing protein [Ruminococcus albus]